MFSFLKKDTIESVRKELYKMYQKGISLFPEPNSEGHQIEVLLTPTQSIELGTGNTITREYNIQSSFHYEYANAAADVLEKLGYDSIHAKFYRLFATHWDMTAF